jgi:lipopolysaccharide/colanic/teichoic acid biosynthesis glycosyltransferase/glycosyltransferase involved in cell wall biosynthesis
VARTGLILDQVVVEHEGRWSTDEPFIGFVESVASALFDTIDLCTRVRRAGQDAPYLLDPDVFRVRRLAWYGGLSALCWKAPALLPRIARTISQAMSHWDFVIACGIHPVSTTALRMARRRGVPAQLWLRGDVAADVRHRYRGLRRMAGLAVVHLAAAGIPAGTPVVSIGRDDYDVLERMGPVHVAFDSKFDAAAVAACPRSWWPAHGAPRMLYVGRLAPEKGLDVLLEALAMLRRAPFALPVTLTIAGAATQGSGYAATLARMVESRGLENAVELGGHVPYGRPLFALYDTHDLLVVPSFTEGFPQVVLEGMARGIPIVATNVGGISRVVEADANGLIVAPGDPGQLARAVATLVEHPERALALSRAGLATAPRFARRGQVDGIVRFTKTCMADAPIDRTRGLPRAVESVLALFGLVLAMPLLVVALLLIAATSPGPPIFRQWRAGRYGRPFAVLKLRTMRGGGEGAAITAGGDPRITPVGRFLRRTKIDELPQLWNVLRGEMSLVGPRPESLQYVDTSDPAWRTVLAVRPGLTDPTTLRFRDEEDLLARAGSDYESFYRRRLLPEKLRGYRAYLSARTWKSDLAVLCRTALHLLHPPRIAPAHAGDG